MPMAATKGWRSAKVGDPFHVVKSLFKHRKTRYRGLGENVAQLMSLFVLANLVPARKRLVELNVQSAS